MDHVTRNKILFIDTSDYEAAKIALVGDLVVEHKFKSPSLSETILPEIKKFLKKRKTSFDQLDKIAVVSGSGGFSRIRTAVAVANALAFGLKIPVISLDKKKVPTDLKKLEQYPSQKMVKPTYDREPNITMKNPK